MQSISTTQFTKCYHALYIYDDINLIQHICNEIELNFVRYFMTPYEQSHFCTLFHFYNADDFKCS